jgi:lysozyme
MARARATLKGLGYAVGGKPDAIARDAVTAFQMDHDLTADGVIGRATLSTLQRRLDAAAQGKAAAAGAAAAVPAAGTGVVDVLAGFPHAGEAILGLALLVALWVAFRHRDTVAAKVHRRLPRLAALLRSF